MKKGQVNIKYAARRVAILNQDKLVGQADRYSTIDYKAIIGYAAKAAAVPESSIEMAMEAIYDAMNYFVLNGHSVQIPNLGTFSIGVRAKGAMSEAEFTAQFSQNLRGVYIHFLPDSELKQMLASTSISTTVEEDERYESSGVIAINSAFFGEGATLIPVNAGRVYQMEELTRFVANGTRLIPRYIGNAPVTITFIKADGTEASLTPAGSSLSFSYNSLSVNLKAIAAAHPEFVTVKQIMVKDLEDNIIYSKQFGTPAEDVPVIGAAVINGKPVAEGGTVPFVAGEQVKITLYGAFFAMADHFKAGTQALTVGQISNEKVGLAFTPATSGNYPITCDYDGGTVSSTYNVSFGEAGGTSITEVTANNDPLVNGGSTNITAGSDYNVQVRGTGLAELTAANFSLPAGTTIEITSQSDTLIQATVGNAQAGAFKITVDSVDVFTATLVAVQTGVSVTGYKLTQNGATQSLGTVIQANSEGAFSVFLVGQNLTDLSDDDFSGSNISISEFDASNGNLVGSISGSSQSSILIRSNYTTVATLYVAPYSSDGGDGLTND